MYSLPFRIVVECESQLVSGGLLGKKVELPEVCGHPR